MMLLENVRQTYNEFAHENLLNINSKYFNSFKFRESYNL